MTYIDVEIEEANIVELKQAPIITYDLVKARGAEVQKQIDSLNLSEIDDTEQNLALIKTIRADLNKDFKLYEEQRKLIKDLIMKPYNEFETFYKESIATLFTKADADLKAKTDLIENGLLSQKIDFHRSYFDEINLFEFLRFEDLNLKIVRSKSDKIIKSEIDEYLFGIQTSLNTIETLGNSQRVLAKFHLCKDLNRAISETNIELQRERAIAEQKAQREAEQKAVQEAEETQKQETQAAEPISHLVKVVFEAVGTIEQIRALKQFMKENNIQFGGTK